MNKLKEIIRENKSVLSNFSYLSALQIFNIAAPLIAYPFLIRVLGTDNFGLVIYAQSIISYFVILVTFGFNISATKKVSLHRNNAKKLGEIVSNVLIIKSILFLLSLFILEVFLYYTKQNRDSVILFNLAMWLCFYEVIFPQWYFQAIEQMKYITYITLLIRIIFLGLIFIIIKSPDDYLLLPIINGVGTIIAGLISIYIIFFKHNIKFRFQPIKKLKYYLNDSLTIFISTISFSVYKSTNKVVVGIFLGMSSITFYDLAEKIIAVAKIPQNILSQSVFPEISLEKNIIYIKKIFKISIIMNFIISVIVLFFAKHLVLLLGDSAMLPSIEIIEILVFSIVIIAMGNVFGIQTLIPFGYDRIFTKVVLRSVILYFFLLFLVWITLGFSIRNISIIIVIVETFSTIYWYYFCKRKKLW